MSFLIPDTTADERLSALERFMEFWLGPRRPEYGATAEMLASAKLPDSLRRFYAFAGRWPPCSPPNYSNRFHVQDRILPLTPAPYGNVTCHGLRLVFLIENQGVWVAATSPEGADPEVWLSEDFFDRDRPHVWLPSINSNATWDFACDTLSHFLVSFALQELMFGSDQVANQEFALASFRRAGCKIDSIWLNGQYSWNKHWPEGRVAYHLIDDRILLQEFVGSEADGQFYGYNDPDCAEFLERHNLSIDIC